jgi:hypothetical protein
MQTESIQVGPLHVKYSQERYMGGEKINIAGPSPNTYVILMILLFMYL